MPFTVNARNALLNNVFRGTQWTGAGSPQADLGRLVIQLTSTPVNPDGTGRTGTGSSLQGFNSGGHWTAASGGSTNYTQNRSLGAALGTVAGLTVQSNIGGPVLYYFNYPTARQMGVGDSAFATNRIKLTME